MDPDHSSFKGRNVLVTGGAGFIGAHLVRRLLNLGCNVRVADKLSRGRKENIAPYMDRVDFWAVDLTNPAKCLEVTREISDVFHLAASVGGIQYIGKENVEGSTPSLLMNTSMLEAATHTGVERFFFASSACVYQERSSGLNRLREEDAFPANPKTTYGWAKIVGEIQCQAYAADYGLGTSAARLFNVYGENENLHPRWSHVIPSLVRKAILYPKEPFRVFGDGNQERAFLYVDDCITGILLTIEKIRNGEAINVGSEELISIGELARKIARLSGKGIEIEYDLSGPQGTHKYCADTGRMKEVLGWSPQTSLDVGLKRIYEWAEGELGCGELDACS